MTKLKNTKKGMAKKALSISLVAAMLATSNVPVWAADFDDGSGTNVQTEGEAPAEVSEFSSDSTPVEEISDTTNELGAATASIDAEIKESGWGTAVTVDVKGISGLGGNDRLSYKWMVNGVQGAGTRSAGTVYANNLNNLTYTPVKQECGQGLQLILTNIDKELEWESDTVSISKRSIAGNTTITQKVQLPNYDGKEHASAEEWVASVVFPAGEISELTSANGDFNISITSDKDLVNADSAITIRVTPKDDRYYTGEAVYTSETLKIQKISWTNVDGTKNLKAEFANNEFEYTGSPIKLKKEDIKVTDKLANGGNGSVLDSEKAILNVWDGQTTGAVNVGSYPAAVSLVAAQLPNYSTVPVEVIGQELTVDGTWKITKRNLANTKITLTPIPASGTEITASSILSAFNKEKVTDLAGNKITGLTTDDFDVKNIQTNSGTPGTYTATLVAKSGSTNFTGETVVTFSVYNKELNATFNGKVGNDDYSTKAEEYTGEPIIKDISKLGDLMEGTSKLTAGISYDTNFVYANNTNAGTASFTVKGLNDYAGSEKTFDFAINAATVTGDDKVANKVVFVDDSTMKPEAYAPAITVKAKNGATPAKEFVLEAGKDYDVTYAYVGPDGEAAVNAIGNRIKVVITIKNDNFKGGSTTFTEYVAISTKQLTDVSVSTENTSYVYTGEAIVPTLIVKDGTTELEKDVDYTIKSISSNKNVGTATVVIAGKGEYDTTSTAETTFTITAADAKDLNVDVNNQPYTGDKKKPASNEMTIKLGKVIITDKFVITYPDSKDANKQVGTGTLTLTPDKANKNFTGTKEVTFNIIGKEIIGGTLQLYKEDGTIDRNREFTYDGTAHTYAKATFVYFDGGRQLEEGTDYEIKYFHNVTGDEDGNGYIAVMGKGNYAGSLDLVDENGATVHPVAMESFEIEKLTLQDQNVKVSNGEYAEGLIVKPNVVVTYGGNVLVEGKDYELTNYGARTEPTTNTASVTVIGKGGYTTPSSGGWHGSPNAGITARWSIDKKDLAKTEISAYRDESTGNVYAVVMNGSVRVPSEKYVVTDNSNGTVTITPVKGSKYYTGSQTVAISNEEDVTAPSAPMISNVKVAGNKATVILSGESDGAAGYDYVISTDRNCITNKDYDKVNKNILTTSTAFTYTQQGTYYAYCHSWKRVDGKKVFSDWSNAYPFVVTSITPEQPVVTKVAVSGTTVKVTYTKAANATGYDIVLGSAVKKVNGEMRPVSYGTLVKKVTKGTTVTATFTKVPKGTYYAGLHAYNRTSENGTKVFSPWSNTKKVTVK